MSFAVKISLTLVLVNECLVTEPHVPSTENKRKIRIAYENYWDDESVWSVKIHDFEVAWFQFCYCMIPSYCTGDVDGLGTKVIGL